MVTHGDGFNEVWLTAHAVTGLIKMNKKKPGENYDMGFVMALLIGFVTVKTIQETEGVDNGILELIEGRNKQSQNALVLPNIYYFNFFLNRLV